MFKQISDKVSLPDLEKEVLDYWRKNNLFEKSVEAHETLSVATAKGGASVDYIYRIRTKAGFDPSQYRRATADEIHARRPAYQAVKLAVANGRSWQRRSGQRLGARRVAIRP